jgi:hypothetical protein
MKGHSFNWFTGVATVNAPCPEAFRGPGGLKPFFVDPNDPVWGTTIPRVLYHETLHVWQFASSQYLRDMVAEEWGRVVALERDGVAPPPGPLRQGFGRPADGQAYSVRDIVECLARFWDVHTRSPMRLMAEEGQDLGELGLAISKQRAAEGHNFYSGVEFDAVMMEGRDREIYARPYLFLREQCLRWLHANDRTGSTASEAIAGWAANLILPLAGFLALNTSHPVTAFDIAVRALLAPEAIGVAFEKRNPWRSINLDWLQFWSVLTGGIARRLTREGLPPRHRQVLENHGLTDHPVWCHLPARFDALLKSLRFDAMFGPGPEADAPPVLAEARRLEREISHDDPWCLFGLPGHPSFRLHLSVAVPAPMQRFDDGEIAATASAADYAPWPVEASQLAAQVAAAEARHGALRDWDAAYRLGLPPGAFAKPLTASG